ncbi:MAG: hypothetical protein ABI822_20810, partial [Bryobacteraceae bacterium]
AYSTARVKRCLSSARRLCLLGLVHSVEWLFSVDRRQLAVCLALLTEVLKQFSERADLSDTQRCWDHWREFVR